MYCLELYRDIELFKFRDISLVNSLVMFYFRSCIVYFKDN